MWKPMWTTNNKRPKKLHLTPEQAKEKALSLLDRRAYSRKGLFDKLKLCADIDVVNEVLDLLEEVGMVDDENYAYQYAHDAMELKMLGPVRVKRELLQRGIAPETAENAISTAEEEIGPPEKRLEELIELKYKNMLFDEKNRAKVVNSLFRLGYEYDMIKETLYKIE